jgi:hypothetical protein
MARDRGPNDLLNTLDMRRILRMTKNQWKGARQRGHVLPPFAYIGTSPRWRWFEVQEWIARGCPALTEDARPVPKPQTRKKAADQKENT